MDEFLKQLRRQLEDVDVEKLLKELDLGKIDLAQLKRVDLTTGKKQVRKQLDQLSRTQREEDASGEGFLPGVILGVVVGAILALIFAPRSGRETREIVTGTASDLMHKADEQTQQDDAGNDADPEASSLPDEPAIERDFGPATATSL